MRAKFIPAQFPLTDKPKSIGVIALQSMMPPHWRSPAGDRHQHTGLRVPSLIPKAGAAVSGEL